MSISLGIVVDRNPLPAWQHAMITDAMDAEFLTCTLIAKPSKPKPVPPKNLLFELYEKLDYALFKPKTSSPNAFQLKALPIEPILWEQASSQNWDVCLDLSTAENNMPAAKTRFGVWRVLLRDEQQFQSGPVGFWEMAQGASVTGSILQVQQHGQAHIIYRSYGKTHPYSLFLSRNEIAWKSSRFVIRNLERLHREGWENLLKTKTTPALNPKPKQQPSIKELLPFWQRILIRYLQHQWKKKRYRIQYRMGLRKRRHLLMQSCLPEFQWITPPSHEFWADPFLYRHQDQHYLFFENYPYETGKGIIAALRINGDGKPSQPITVLERDYHLSYPLVFEHQGVIYMIPETSENRTIELYRNLAFPNRWELVKLLLQDISAHDVTLFAHQEKWWLFANVVERHGSVNDELFLFHADSLFGKWTPHPQNPIVSDVRRARSAGQLFWNNGQLIRPSQDCSKHYGYALNFNQVDCLNENHYEEHLLYKIVPDGFKDFHGIHTYNANETFEVIDMVKHIPR